MRNTIYKDQLKTNIKTIGCSRTQKYACGWGISVPGFDKYQLETITISDTTTISYAEYSYLILPAAHLETKKSNHLRSNDIIFKA